MRGPRSLQGRLGLWLGLALGLVWLAAASLTALTARQEMEEVFDSALQETAQRLLPLAVVDILERENEGLTQRIHAIRENILRNDFSREKLAPGQAPRPLAFLVEDAGAGRALYAQRDAVDGTRPIFVGIDLTTGEFQVEGAAALWDELFAFRGLDAADLENPFLVAQYVALKGRGW